VVAEVLTNVAKYASASAVEVRVGRQDGHLIVSVADDGTRDAEAAGGSGLLVWPIASRCSGLPGGAQLSRRGDDGGRPSARGDAPRGDAA
jgi:glucose-6-phosphate-specific signal transduction histidine kinase